MRRQSIMWSPSAVTVITRDEIRTSGANEFHDLLRRVPGMDVFDMKTYYPLLGSRALAGLFSNRVLLLIDGREQLWELTGGAVWGALSVDLEEVERIEVIRGPGSALYGANAFAGVINIITVSDSSTARREALVSGGDSGRLRLLGRVRDGWDLGDGRLAGAFSRRRPPGVPGAVFQPVQRQGFFRSGCSLAAGRSRYQQLRHQV